MDATDTLERLRRIVAEVRKVPPERVAPEDRLDDLDSMDRMEVLMAVEEEFAPEVSAADAASLTEGTWTLRELADWVDAHRAE
jgi:acyl carrier protein